MLLISVLVLGLGFSVSAHEGEDHGDPTPTLDFTKIVDTSDAVAAGLTLFKEEATAEQVKTYIGIKAKPVEGGVTVIIYLKADEENTSVVYNCHRHEDDEPFECHED